MTRAFLTQHWPPIWPEPGLRLGPLGSRGGHWTDSGGHRRPLVKRKPLAALQEAPRASVLSGEGAGCRLWSCEQLSARQSISGSRSSAVQSSALGCF